MSSLDKELHTTIQRQTMPFRVHVAHKLEDLLDNINWLHVAFKTCAFAYITVIAWITWQVLPVRGHWDIARQSDKIPTGFQDLTNYFGSFNGYSECGFRALDLYSAPPQDGHGNYISNIFCSNRKALLQAMSSGGRVGFDAPYNPRDCQYRWYSIAEACMILERFDGVVFIGDSNLQSIYNGLNILLRQDLANGALQTWDMTPSEEADCRCDNQFTKPDCARHFITASGQVSKNIGRNNIETLGNSYLCDRTPHTFTQIGPGNPPQSAINAFHKAVPKAPRSNYKPIPIIHSLTPITASHQQASTSLLEILKEADLSERKTPMLWIGPTAAGHIEIKGRKTNQEIWGFDEAMAKTAGDNDIEVLKMWNLTVQASSWDGVRFGEKVALEQAMMVINWLGRLESS